MIHCKVNPLIYHRVLWSNVNHARDSLVHFNNISIMLWKFSFYEHKHTQKTQGEVAKDKVLAMSPESLSP